MYISGGFRGEFQGVIPQCFCARQDHRQPTERAWRTTSICPAERQSPGHGQSDAAPSRDHSEPKRAGKLVKVIADTKGNAGLTTRCPRYAYVTAVQGRHRASGRGRRRHRHPPETSPKYTRPRQRTDWFTTHGAGAHRESHARAYDAIRWTTALTAPTFPPRHRRASQLL